MVMKTRCMLVVARAASEYIQALIQATSATPPLMNETQRQAYLQAMGIQAYFPRVPVAGAKQSPVYIVASPAEVTTNAAVIAAKPAPVAATPAPRAARVSKPQTAITQTPAVATATVVELSPVASAPLPEVLDALRFHLQYYRINDTLAVIDEIPFQQTRKAPDTTIVLLKAILRALEVDCQAATFQADAFNWPLETGMVMKGDPAQAAQQALLGYIKMRQQRDGFQYLLIFAAQLSTLLPDAAELKQDVSARREQQAITDTYRITTTHSLQSLLAHPILKRETWAHLQDLRRQLASKSK